MVSTLLDALPLAVELGAELEPAPALQPAAASRPTTMMTPYLVRRLMVSSLPLLSYGARATRVP
jgi:hypothetical protein